MSQYFCKKCGRSMDANQFYTSNDLEKYPNDGKLDICKKCITLHVDNWDPETYKPILKEVDVPYIKSEWDSLLEKYGKDPKKITGMTILGRYLSKMKLKQHQNERWADTERLEEEAKNSKIEQMKRAGYSGEQIEEQLSTDRTPPKPEEIIEEDGVPVYVEEPDEFEDKLTEEDKTYLRLKWGKSYRAEEWVALEQLYEDMMASYDIQGAGQKDNLKMLCKTSLKANQLIDMGDVEGFQKMSKTYDMLMKSGKFTAAQNKSESGEFVDSIGELVAICEKEGFIPRYYTDGPQDKVDRTLEDLKGYTRSLVTEETNLGEMIEASMKEIQKDREREAHLDVYDEEEDFEEEIFSEDSEQIIQDSDFSDFKEQEELQRKQDELYLKSLEDK